MHDDTGALLVEDGRGLVDFEGDYLDLIRSLTIRGEALFGKTLHFDLDMEVTGRCVWLNSACLILKLVVNVKINFVERMGTIGVF